MVPLGSKRFPCSIRMISSRMSFLETNLFSFFAPGGREQGGEPLTLWVIPGMGQLRNSTPDPSGRGGSVPIVCWKGHSPKGKQKTSAPWDGNALKCSLLDNPGCDIQTCGGTLTIPGWGEVLGRFLGVCAFHEEHRVLVDKVWRSFWGNSTLFVLKFITGAGGESF